MSFIIFLSKIYIIILLLRYVTTTQELVFNPLGKIIATLTNPIIPVKNGNKYIPLWIAGIVIVSSLLYSIASILTVFLLNFNKILVEYIQFFMQSYIVFIIFGSLGNRPIGYTALFFRLGLPWVKLTRLIIPINSGKIVIPAVIFVYILAVSFTLITQTIFNVVIDQNIGNTLRILISSMANSAYHLFDLLFMMSFIIAARALISWVSPDPRNILVQFIYVVTEPILEPLRKLIPPVGFIDFSALIAMLGFYFSSLVLKGIVSPFIF